MKKLLPKKFILIEGIDGGGKTTFVNFLEKEIKNNFTYSSKRTLSIVGQPFYSLEKNNSLSNIFLFNQSYICNLWLFVLK